MKEQDLKDLGFKCHFIDAEESGDVAFHYYTYDIGDICLISNANDEALKNGWIIELFDFKTLKITNIEDLKNLIEILRKYSI